MAIDDIGLTEDWISLLRAADFLGKSLGLEAARNDILCYLSEGRLDLQADLAVQEADIREPYFDLDIWSWREHRPLGVGGQADKSWAKVRDDLSLVSVPADFFALADGWEIDHHAVDWPNCRVLARRPFKALKIRQRWLLKGSDGIVRKPDPDPAFMRRFVGGLSVSRHQLESMVGLKILGEQHSGNLEPGADHPKVAALKERMNKPRAVGKVCAELVELIELNLMSQLLETPLVPSAKGKIRDYLVGLALRKNGKLYSPRQCLRFAGDIYDAWQAFETDRRPIVLAKFGLG